MRCRLVTGAESAKHSIVESWGTLTSLASSEISGSDITVARVIIKPGKSNPRHSHDNCEEVLHLLHGKLKPIFYTAKKKLV